MALVGSSKFPERPLLPPVLKLARTISDLAGEERIAAQNLAEALRYRPRGLM